MPRDVFVSYSQPDRETALALVTYIEAQGIGCWVAPRDVAPATDWAAEIIAAIAAARVMVLVFSASANSSPQVRREVERAVHRDVAVLPVRIEDVLPSQSLEYFLSSQHWLDAFPPPIEPHFARLGTYLKTLLAGAAQPAAAATARVAPPVDSATHKVLPDAATLHRLESQLALYIGPFARHLVNRAAARGAGLEALIAELSAEIESEHERRQFINACRRAVGG
jgi:TIR domain-containing protein